MKKKLQHYLFSFVITLVIISAPQTLRAVDVCASNLVYCNNKAQCRTAAEALCVPACQKIGGTWNGAWNNTDPACHWFWSGQYAVCGCTPPPPCKCEGENQESLCTEAEKCSSNCDCRNGRSCKDGTCVDGYFCGNSNKYCPTGLYCGPSGYCQTSNDCCSSCWHVYEDEIIACAGGPLGACQEEATQMYTQCQQTCNCPPSYLEKRKNQDKKQKRLPLTPLARPKSKEEVRKTPSLTPKEKGDQRNIR